MIGATQLIRRSHLSAARRRCKHDGRSRHGVMPLLHGQAAPSPFLCHCESEMSEIPGSAETESVGRDAARLACVPADHFVRRAVR
jgi:hypothetical protein